MKRTTAAFLVSLAMVVASCGEPPAETSEVRAADLPPAEVAGEIESERVSPDDMTADWPALAAAADGSVWLAYVEWNGSDADAVVVRRRSPEGTWGGPIVLDDG
ncbi:MAG: hypothetical protein F4X77_05865, partial [Acidobacteriia bacterium]|nr:hypothetical protein [Terriglobia bacterium]